MRISDPMRFKMAFEGLTRPRERLGTIQEQVTSGKVINRPSDDPSGAARVLDLRETLANIDQYRQDADRGRTLLGGTEEALVGAENIIVRMRELAVQMANDTNSPADRRSAAVEVRGAMEHLVDLSNSRVGESYIFGGFKSGAPPYQADGTFVGDSGTLELDVGEGVRLPVNVDGDATFSGIVGNLEAFALALEADDQDAIETTIDDMIADQEQLLDSRVSVGTMLNRVDFAEQVLDRLDVDVQSQLSGLEDADMVETLTSFQQEELALQASLRMAARMFQPTLMDFLR